MANRKSAFTLVEMLIVIGIIILAMTLAVPAVRALTGSHSEQAAQNTISAFLATARAEAIGLQRIQGVLFLIDPATDRVNLVQVMQTLPEALQPNTPVAADRPGFVYLDLVPGHDPLVIPAGIRAWGLKDQPPRAYVNVIDRFPNYRYLGYNFYDPVGAGPDPRDATLGPVVLFDGQGRLLAAPYAYRYVHYPLSSGGKPVPTPLGQLAFKISITNGSSPTGNWPGPNAGLVFLRSQVALVLFDREVFTGYVTNTLASSKAPDSNPTDPKVQAGIDSWLDANATPILINRFSGTLTRAE